MFMVLCSESVNARVVMAALKGSCRRAVYVTDDVTDDVFDNVTNDVNNRCKNESRDQAPSLPGQNRTNFYITRSNIKMSAINQSKL